MTVVKLPGDRKRTPVLTVTRQLADKYLWQEGKAEGLQVQGVLAQRILEVMAVPRSNYDQRQSRPNCHGAAFYVMGQVDEPEFLGIEEHTLPEELTIEPKDTPTILHIEREHDRPLNERNLRHTVVLLGEIAGQKVCFEKRGIYKARFSPLDLVGKYYMAEHRLYHR